MACHFVALFVELLDEGACRELRTYKPSDWNRAAIGIGARACQFEHVFDN